MTHREALIALRDGTDTEQVHCEPVPVTSSQRYVIDLALDGEKHPVEMIADACEGKITSAGALPDGSGFATV